MLSWGEPKPRVPEAYKTEILDYQGNYERSRVFLILFALLSGMLLFQGSRQTPAILIYTVTVGLAVRFLLIRMLYFNARETAEQLRKHLDRMEDTQ